MTMGEGLLIDHATAMHILHLVEREMSLSLPLARLHHFDSNLKQVCRDKGLTPNQILQSIESGSLDEQVWDELIHAATIHETQFYRFPNIYHYIKQRLNGMKRASVWCAACSNGKEVYTIAEVLTNSVDKLEVVGTDISIKSVIEAQTARYSAGRKGDSLKQIKANPGTEWQVPSSIVKHCSFETHNLAGESVYREGYFDVVICTKALLYYPHAERHRMLDLMGRSLKLGGVICVAHLEDASWSNPQFNEIQLSEFKLFERVDARES